VDVTTLHVVRGDDPAGGPPIDLVADADWIVYLHPAPRLVTPATIPAGPNTHDDLVALCFAADRVITW
jgi:hypothetical protein